METGRELSSCVEWKRAELLGNFFSLSADKATYAYDYSYRQSFMGYADWVNGSHVDDVFSVFGEPFLQPIREVNMHRLPQIRERETERQRESVRERE